MNWKEFKAYIEDQGVTDNMQIEDIIVMSPSIHPESGHYPPRVYIHPGYPHKSILIL